tara:strand:- start:249 stop:869 length:621 start_codon:yes stop_codon:yes gene_type:complete
MSQIPAFLIEMSKQMHEQDNRCTAEPIWVVCYDEWLTCADDRGDKSVLLLSDGGDHYVECDDADHSDIFDHLKEYYPEWCIKTLKDIDDDLDDIDDLLDYIDLDDLWVDLPFGVTIEKIDMQKVVHKTKYCLTEADANGFIQRKQHDYKKLYTYVESMNYCPQMIELRNWILSLTTECGGKDAEKLKQSNHDALINSIIESTGGEI